MKIQVCASLCLSLACLPPAASAAGESEYYWYDGDVKRQVIMAEDDDPGGGTGSPAFDQNGHRMELPGGVLVRFLPDWNTNRVKAWMQQQGYTEYRPVLSNHTWLIHTDPGLPALTIANIIHESGEVVYASPNWSREQQQR